MRVLKQFAEQAAFLGEKFTERSYGISPCTGIGRGFILVCEACVFSISVAASSHPLSLEMFFRSFMVSCFESPCTYERVGLLVFHCAPVRDDMTQRAVHFPRCVGCCCCCSFMLCASVFRLIDRSTLFSGNFPSLHALLGGRFCSLSGAQL